MVRENEKVMEGRGYFDQSMIYRGLKYHGETPLDYQYILSFKKMKGRREK
jgi:hypothetical protein